MKLHAFELIKNRHLTEDLPMILQHSTYTEKYDTHYVKVKILSTKKIICCKADGTPLYSSDFILNKMWSDFINDWTLIQTNDAFKSFLVQYVGCSLGLFYFPCKRPLNVEYAFNNDRLYVFHQIYDIYNKVEIPINKNEINELISTWQESDYSAQIGLRYYGYYNLSDTFIHYLVNTENLDGWQEHFVGPHLCSDLSDLELVIKYHKQYYQLTNNKQHKAVSTDIERTSYEFVLCDFIKFFNQTKMINKIRGTYKQIVCQCFNDYIDKWEKKSGYIKKNINPEALIPPHIGYYHSDNINSIYISNTRTLELCQESELYKNIFKLLLANLKSFKKKKYCVYMNDNQITEMNNIVRTIQHIKTDTQYK